MAKRMNIDIRDGWFAVQSAYKDRMIRIAFTRMPPGLEGVAIQKGRADDFLFLTVLWPRSLVCTSDALGQSKPVGLTYASMVIEPMRLVGVDAEYIHERLGRPMDESRAVASLLTRVAIDRRFADWLEQCRCQS